MVHFVHRQLIFRCCFCEFFTQQIQLLTQCLGIDDVFLSSLLLQYLTAESHESLGSAKIGPAKAGESSGRAKARLIMLEPKELSEACRRKSSSVGKNRRLIPLCGNYDEGDLIDMLNDPGSELYRLFAHHNPNKTPQQCFFDLKYSPPEDTESRSLYGKVLKYAQLYNKLGQRIKGGNTRRAENTQKLKGGEAVLSDTLPDKGDIKREKKKNSVPFPKLLHSDGACDRLKEKKTAVTSTVNNPLTSLTRKNPEAKADFDPDAALLRSYQKALDTTNVETQMRLAMLDSDYNKIGQRFEGSDGTLGHLLRRHRSEPPSSGKCFVRNLPMRANKIQHSLSSVSSIEVHKTNTSCSMSSTSISISTCEFVSLRCLIVVACQCLSNPSNRYLTCRRRSAMTPCRISWTRFARWSLRSNAAGTQHQTRYGGT